MKELEYSNVQSYSDTQNFIGGKRVSSKSGNAVDIYSPINGQKISSVGQSTISELDEAISVASDAFKIWSKLTIHKRANVIFNYQRLLEDNRAKLARIVSDENGKILSEASAEVSKAIEIAKSSCSMASLSSGKILEVTRGLMCQNSIVPLGVVASITPFNFPIMVPSWTIPNILVLGNSMVLKPSEQTPISPLYLADLLREAGLPDGAFNVVQGDKKIVGRICEHPDIKAVSFVGSTEIAKIVYSKATSHLKRALCLGSAKNHLLVFPDAEQNITSDNIVNSASGCAGQRCMAAAVMVTIGDCKHIIDLICKNAREIKLGIDLGAVISKQAKDRIENYIASAENSGVNIRHVPI